MNVYILKNLYNIAETLALSYGEEPFFSFYSFIIQYPIVDETDYEYIIEIPDEEYNNYISLLSEVHRVLSENTIEIPKDILEKIRNNYPDFYDFYYPLLYIYDDTGDRIIAGSSPTVISEWHNAINTILSQFASQHLYILKQLYNIIENLALNLGEEPFFTAYSIISQYPIVGETEYEYILEIPQEDYDVVISELRNVNTVLSENVIEIPKDVLEEVRNNYPDFYSFYYPLLYIYDDTGDRIIAGSSPTVINEWYNVINEVKFGNKVYLLKHLYNVALNIASAYNIEPFKSFVDLVSQAPLVGETEYEYIIALAGDEYDKYISLLNQIHKILSDNVLYIPKEILQKIQEKYPSFYENYFRYLYIYDDTGTDLVVGSIPDVVEKWRELINRLSTSEETYSDVGRKARIKIKVYYYNYIVKNAEEGYEPFVTAVMIMDDLEKETTPTEVILTGDERKIRQLAKVLSDIKVLTERNQVIVKKRDLQLLARVSAEDYKRLMELIYIISDAGDAFIIGGHKKVIEELLKKINEAKRKVAEGGTTKKPPAPYPPTRSPRTTPPRTPSPTPTPTPPGRPPTSPMPYPRDRMPYPQPQPQPQPRPQPQPQPAPTPVPTPAPAPSPVPKYPPAPMPSPRYPRKPPIMVKKDMDNLMMLMGLGAFAVLGMAILSPKEKRKKNEEKRKENTERQEQEKEEEKIREGEKKQSWMMKIFGNKNRKRR